VDDQIGAASTGASLVNARPSARATDSRAGSMSTTDDLGTRQPLQSQAMSRPTTPAPTTTMRSPVAGPSVPDRVHRRLHVRREHRAPGRHVIGQRVTAARRHAVAILVGVEAEDASADEIAPSGRTLSTTCRRCCSRTSPAREVAFLERRAHRLVL
jgi:hypothetical protein